MKKWLKIIGIIVGIVAVIILGGVTYLFTAFPKYSEARELKVEITPARVERGKYLAEKVMLCKSCHSARDFKLYAGPIPEGKEFAGGEEFKDVFGTLYSANLTPAGIGEFSDGELFRTITEGVRHDGSPMFPVMPYPLFSTFSEEDIFSVIAYLRTLAPIENEVPKTELKFPFNLIVRTIPKPYVSQPEADVSTPEKRGKFISQACVYCHTPVDDKGQQLPGMLAAGGLKFWMPNGKVLKSVNITPDEETGLGKWSQDQFIERFKSFDKPEISRIYVENNTTNTVMPWHELSKLDSTDLASIYSYLKTLPPVKNKVERFSEETWTE